MIVPASAATEYAIETSGLTRRFGEFVAVDNVTLKIPKGQLYGFLGLNGAGKTTTIRLLTTLLPPSAGTAKLWGHDVVTEPLAVRKLVGLVSDETSESQSSWTAREYLSYFARVRRLANPNEEVERILDDVGLAVKFRGKLICTYSTGMKRRVEIARALMGNPKAANLRACIFEWSKMLLELSVLSFSASFGPGFDPDLSRKWGRVKTRQLCPKNLCQERGSPQKLGATWVQNPPNTARSKRQNGATYPLCSRSPILIGRAYRGRSSAILVMISALLTTREVPKMGLDGSTGTRSTLPSTIDGNDPINGT